MAMSLFSRFQYKRQLNKKRRQLENKGFSLIEVLVAIAILAVLSLPVLSAFMSAAKVNLKARQEENANAVAQKVMEDMKAKHIEQVMNEQGSSKVIGAESSVTGLKTYTLNMGNYDSTGKVYSDTSTGDEFYVRVTLDPDEFADVLPGKGYSEGNTNNNINTFNMPAFTEVMSTDNFAIMRQVYQNDNAAIAALGGDASKIHREMDVYINVSKKDLTTYTQEVSVEVAYVHEDGRRVGYSSTIGTQEIAVDVEESKYRNVYLFYTPFDKYRNESTDYKSKDVVNFHMYTDTPMGALQPTGVSAKYMNIYLVEQTAVNVTTGYAVTLDNTKIKMYEKVSGLVQPIDLSHVSSNGSKGLGTLRNINLLTNVGGFTNVVAGNVQNSITSSVNPDSEIKYLYNMKVEVWVNETPADGNPAFWTVMSTKENANE